MKKILVALMLSLSIGLSTTAKSAVIDPVTVAMFVAGFMAGSQWNQPIPYSLTDACKAQFVAKAGTNYGYSSYEHCLNK